MTVIIPRSISDSKAVGFAAESRRFISLSDRFPDLNQYCAQIFMKTPCASRSSRVMSPVIHFAASNLNQGRLSAIALASFIVSASVLKHINSLRRCIDSPHAALLAFISLNTPNSLIG